MTYGLYCLEGAGAAGNERGGLCGEAGLECFLFKRLKARETERSTPPIPDFEATLGTDWV